MLAYTCYRMFSVTSSYVEGTSCVHRCDARVKILVLLAFSIAVFLVRTWWGMAGFALAIAVLALVARVPFGLLNRMLVPVYVLAGFTFAFHVLADPSLEGVASGGFFAVRMIVLVAASFVVCLTTTSSELLEAFRRLIAPLRAVRFPVDDAAFTLALSLRFIPVIEEEFARIRAAQVARGAESAKSPIRKARVWACAFEALFVGLFRHADTLASAMDARCYGAAPSRTRLRK